MKKITLFFFALMAFQYAKSQDSCAGALVATPGTISVGTINGTVPTPVCAQNGDVPVADGPAGEWYIYTATISGIANVTSNLPANTGGDTRVHIYTGPCGALTCHAGNDDVSGTNYLSNVTFPVTAGTSYYIAWDNRWADDAFSFTLSETVVDCSTSSPYSYDFVSINPLIACYEIENANADGTTWGYNNGNDVNGDGNPDGMGVIFPPNPTVAKDDWLYLPVFNGVANAEYSITLTYNAFNNPIAASESFEIVVLDTPSSTATSQTQIGTYTGITQNGAGVGDLQPNAYSSTATYTPTADGDFYIGIHVTTPVATSGIFMLFSINANTTLGLDEFDSNNFKHYYNNATDVLTLESSISPLSNVEMYNMLGQVVINKNLSQTTEKLNLSEFKDGVYIVKATINNQITSFKLLKQ